MDLVRSPSEELLDLLVEERVIEPAAADAMRLRLREGWVPLGKVLRVQGLLTMAQLVEVLQAQSKEPHRRLGDLAVAKGFCTPEQVRNALQHQTQQAPHLLDLLAEEPQLDPMVVMRTVARYVRTLERRLSEPRSAGA